MSEGTTQTDLAPISVAISTRARPDALGRCLDALLAGERLPAEIVVVDQSRDDRSRAAELGPLRARARGDRVQPRLLGPERQHPAG